MSSKTSCGECGTFLMRPDETCPNCANEMELERARTNLILDTESMENTGAQDTPVIAHSRRGCNIHYDHDPNGRFVISWYWKEWAPSRRRWWHRLFGITPFTFVWIRYSLRVKEWNPDQLRAVVSMKKCFGLMVEEDGDQGAHYLQTRKSNA